MKQEAKTKPAPRPIAPQTRMGPVHLRVTDAPRAVSFYVDLLGLDRRPSQQGRVALGTAERDLVILHPGAEQGVVPHTTGLYHLAMVVPSRKELARVIARLSQLGWPQSPTDHLMTKSDYVWDPDGNGVEIYAETPEDGTWAFGEHDFFAFDRQGRRRSGRDPINLEEMFAHLTPEDSLRAPLPNETRMGHVHLHVADLADAVRFYNELVGFDITGQMSTAAFVSAGGYHHHLGLNTWAGRGAPAPPANAAGLEFFTIEPPNDKDLSEVLARLSGGGITVRETEDGFEAADPSLNRFRLRAS